MENNDICIKCNEKEAYCRLMCQSCYGKELRSTPEGKEKTKLYNKKYRSTPRGKEITKLNNLKRKEYRKTPEGKEKTKLYNATKGLIARAKYLSKKPPKPPKEVKICDCGGIVIAKNLCRNCYQRKREGYSLTKRKKKDYTEIFEEVLKLVKKGNSIQNSFKILGVHSSQFYSHTTPIQKKELKHEKLIAKGLKIVNYLD